MLLLWRCLKRCWVLAKGLPAHTLAKHMQTHRVAFYIHMLDHVSLWNNIMADFCFPFLFSPGLQCRSWPSHLSGITTGSEYLVIYIHSPMVQHVLICPPSVNNEHAIQRASVLSSFWSITFFSLSGEFVFGLSSDDNSEFWLSTDESPLNVQLLAWVGKVCTSNGHSH